MAPTSSKQEVEKKKETKQKNGKEREITTLSISKAYRKRLEKFFPLFVVLKQTSAKKRRLLLGYLSAESITFLCELISNVVYKNKVFNFSKTRVRKLHKELKNFKKEYKEIINPEVPIKKKVVLLQEQSGAGLGTILASVLPFFMDLFL